VPLPGFEGAVDLRAKLDQVVYDSSTGLFSFLDHKTADDFKRHDMTEMDPQMAMYSLIAWLRSQGTAPVPGMAPAIRNDLPLVNGGIINTLRRVKRTRNSKPPYYDRHPFRHNPEQLAATLAGIQQVASEILNARAQLDAAYSRGGVPEQIHWIQLTTMRPVKIIGDCDWRCPLSSGMCQMMDDGLGWMQALVSGGGYVQGDAYARYTRNGLDVVRAQLATGQG
jgi:hypothetical protein